MKKIFIFMLGIICMVSCKTKVQPLSETTTFKEVNNVALTTVLPEHPTAYLLEIHSTLARNEEGELIHNQIITDKTEVVFRLRGKEKGTLYVNFVNGLPVVTTDGKLFLGDYPIPHFIDLGVGGAIEILNEKCYDIPADKVSLRQPTNLGSFEPQYVFGTIGTGSVNVGVYSRNIY